MRIAVAHHEMSPLPEDAFTIATVETGIVRHSISYHGKMSHMDVWESFKFGFTDERGTQNAADKLFCLEILEKAGLYDSAMIFATAALKNLEREMGAELVADMK